MFPAHKEKHDLGQERKKRQACLFSLQMKPPRTDALTRVSMRKHRSGADQDLIVSPLVPHLDHVVVAPEAAVARQPKGAKQARAAAEDLHSVRQCESGSGRPLNVSATRRPAL